MKPLKMLKTAAGAGAIMGVLALSAHAIPAAASGPWPTSVADTGPNFPAPRAEAFESTQPRAHVTTPRTVPETSPVGVAPTRPAVGEIRIMAEPLPHQVVVPSSVNESMPARTGGQRLPTVDGPFDR
jgi:hypothetical protein